MLDLLMVVGMLLKQQLFNYLPLFWIGLTNLSNLCILIMLHKSQDEHLEPDNVYKGKDQDRTWTCLQTVPLQYFGIINHHDI